LNNQTFVNKSKSLWDKVSGVFEEEKAVKTSVVEHATVEHAPRDNKYESLKQKLQIGTEEL